MKHILFIATMALAILWGCESAQKPVAEKGNWAHAAVVADVIQTTNYTYLEVEENKELYWIAIPKSDFVKGQNVFYNSGLPMNNFESKELNRTFEKVLFVQVVSDKPSGPGDMAPRERAKVNKSGGTKKKVEITPLKDGLTLADVFRDKSKLADKEITVKGIVTKFNPAIMNRNWVHIQDGTEGNGYFDLTLTTQDETKVGEVIVVKGILRLNKDFGSGYTYDLILEEATLQREM